MAKKIRIGARFQSVTVEGILASASEILDEQKNQKQSDINREVAERLDGMPKKVSDLENDAEYATQGDLDDGLDTKQDKISVIEDATITETGGEPTARVYFNDNKMKFAYENLKGGRGNGVKSSSEILSPIDGEQNTHIIVDDDGKEHIFHTRNGKTGKQGETALYDENNPPVKVATIKTTMGDSQTDTMTQKAISDAIQDYATEEWMPQTLDSKKQMGLLSGNVVSKSSNDFIIYYMAVAEMDCVKITPALAEGKYFYVTIGDEAPAVGKTYTYPLTTLPSDGEEHRYYATRSGILWIYVTAKQAVTATKAFTKTNALKERTDESIKQSRQKVEEEMYDISYEKTEKTLTQVSGVVINTSTNMIEASQWQSCYYMKVDEGDIVLLQVVISQATNIRAGFTADVPATNVDVQGARLLALDTSAQARLVAPIDGYVVMSHNNTYESEDHVYLLEETSPRMTDGDDADLDFVDKNDNVLLRLKGGHVKTKNFDSSKMGIEAKDEPLADISFEDENGNVVMKVEDGHVKTRNFDSSRPQQALSLCLPSHIYSYVGDRVQIYKYPMIQMPNYKDYGITLWIESSSANVRKQGKTLGRYFEFVPTSTGTYVIKAAVTDSALNILASKDIVVDVITPASPETKKNILLIGDSETLGTVNNSGISVAQGASEEGNHPFSDELERLLTSDDEATETAPAGLGLNVQLIGTQNTSGGRHEGYGGWSVEDFISSSSPFYINGAINFNSYLNKAAVYKDETNKGVDIICIMLGANGATDVVEFEGKAVVMVRDSYVDGINSLLTSINAQLTEGGTHYNPNLKIMLLSYIFPYIEGRGFHPNGMAAYRDGNLSAKAMKVLYDKNCEIAAQYDNVESVLISPFVDSENGFAWMEKQMNPYSEDTEKVLIENLHPNTLAYKMYAYALVRNIIGNI